MKHEPKIGQTWLYDDQLIVLLISNIDARGPHFFRCMTLDQPSNGLWDTIDIVCIRSHDSFNNLIWKRLA